jgi:hypothetical protein
MYKSRLRRGTLDLSKKLVARRPLRFAGKDYAAGDQFPWRKLGVAERQVGILFDAGKLEMVEKKPEAPEPPVKKVAAKKAPARKTPGKVTPEPTDNA